MPLRGVRDPASRPTSRAPTRARDVAAAERHPARESVTRAPATNGGPRVDEQAAVEAMLATGARLPRSRGPEGKEPLLNPREVERARDALHRCSPRHRTRLFDALRTLDGVAAPFARGLVLRAVAARASSLAGPRAEAAVRVVERFAMRLHGLDEETLAARATALDLDSTTNTSAFAPLGLWDKRGVTSPRGAGDTDAGNDGLFQRFTATCGPTTLQLMLAEADPVVAFALSERGLHRDSTTDATARFQRALLEAYGGVAIGRAEAHLRARLRNCLGRCTGAGALSERDKEALLRHALRQGPLDDGARRALDTVRARYRGFPDDTALARLRQEVWPETDEGIGTDALRALLDEHVTPLAGVRYRSTDPPEGFARGQAYRHIDDVARALKAGYDVPFGLCEPAHWMLLSAVRGRRPRRELLVSDPDSGRTAWVTERDFVRGTFAVHPFAITETGDRPYVDCFLLPEPGA